MFQLMKLHFKRISHFVVTCIGVHSQHAEDLTPKEVWSPIWASHSYDTSKFYNVNMGCDVTIWQIACCLARLFFLLPTQVTK